MNSALDYLIKDIETLARAKDPEALTQASELVAKYPNDAKAWSLRAYVFGRNGHWSNAIDDLTRAINIWPTEPGLFFIAVDIISNWMNFIAPLMTSIKA